MKVWEKDGQKTIRPDEGDLGGTMRLGAYPCILQPGSLASRIYEGADKIYERHRHRYEMDISYADKLLDKGFVVSGKSPDGLLPEIVEIPAHPFFLPVNFTRNLSQNPLRLIRCLRLLFEQRLNNLIYYNSGDRTI